MHQDRAAADRRKYLDNDNDSVGSAGHDPLNLPSYNPFGKRGTRSKNTHEEEPPGMTRVTSALSENFPSTKTKHHQQSPDFEEIRVPHPANSTPTMGIASGHSVYRSSPLVSTFVDVEASKSATILNEELPSGSAISSHFFALLWNRLRSKFHIINESRIPRVSSAFRQMGIENMLLNSPTRQKQVLLIDFKDDEIIRKIAVPLFLGEKVSLTLCWTQRIARTKASAVPMPS